MALGHDLRRIMATFGQTHVFPVNVDIHHFPKKRFHLIVQLRTMLDSMFVLESLISNMWVPIGWFRHTHNYCVVNLGFIYLHGPTYIVVPVGAEVLIEPDLWIGFVGSSRFRVKSGPVS